MQLLKPHFAVDPVKNKKKSERERKSSNISEKAVPKKYSEDASGKEKEGLELLLSQYANKLSHVLEEEMKHKIKIHEMEQEIRRLKG